MEYNSSWVFEQDDEGVTDIIVFEAMAPQEQTEGARVLRLADSSECRGNCIDRLSSSRYWVYEGVSLDELVQDLTPREDLFAVAVLDAEGEALGLIIRRELFDMLGRQHRQDAAAEASLRPLIRHVKSFLPETNVLSVADMIQEDMQSHLIRYFILKDTDGRFRGIFSTKDMLIHLSDMLKRDIATVRGFQSKVVLPESFLKEGKLSCTGFSRPAKDAGGDYYAFRRLFNGSILAIIADVSGKGVGASYFTAACAACADAFAFSAGLASYLRTLNRHLARCYSETGSFMTAVAMLIDPHDGTVQICDMGHSYIYLVREKRCTAVSLPSCTPLGIEEDMEIHIRQFKLHEGDLLFAITDGIAEQRGSNTEEYGVARPLRIVSGLQDMTTMRAALLTDIDRFRGIQVQHDDLTAIALRFGNGE